MNKLIKPGLNSALAAVVWARHATRSLSHEEGSSLRDEPKQWLQRRLALS